MLHVTLVGNLGTDPSVGATQRGTPIATLRVAVNQARTDTTTGERVERAEWFRVRAMGRLVDLAQRLSKGTRVLVIGRLDIAHYLSSEGDPRISYDVWADDLVPFPARNDGGGTGTARQDNPHPPTAQGQAPGAASRDQDPHPHPVQPAGSRTPSDPEDEDLPW